MGLAVGGRESRAGHERRYFTHFDRPTSHVAKYTAEAVVAGAIFGTIPAVLLAVGGSRAALPTGAIMGGLLAGGVFGNDWLRDSYTFRYDESGNRADVG
jgi:hypothetical protein